MDESTATAGTESTPAATPAPVTARAALEQTAPPAVTPDASAAPPVDTPEAATTPPVEDASVSESASETPKGEPPKWRWQDILANARETTAKETEARVKAEIERQYSWARDIQEQERQGLLVLRAAINGDPRATQIVRSNPEIFGALKGVIAAPPQESEPEPDLQAQDGTLVYSAKQQKAWQDWNTRRLQQEFESKLKPFEAVKQQMELAKAESDYRDASVKAVDMLKSKYPDFAKHTGDVWKVLEANPTLHEQALDPRTAEQALTYAWHQVYIEKIVPTLLKSSEGQTLASLQQRAVAATLNPGTAAPTTPKSTIGDARAALLAAGVE